MKIGAEKQRQKHKRKGRAIKNQTTNGGEGNKKLKHKKGDKGRIKIKKLS
jgi:hypothetical protein